MAPHCSHTTAGIDPERAQPGAEAAVRAALGTEASETSSRTLIRNTRAGDTWTPPVRRERAVPRPSLQGTDRIEENPCSPPAYEADRTSSWNTTTFARSVVALQDTLRPCAP